VRVIAPYGAREIEAGRLRQKKKTMANVDVLNLNGEKVASLELADALFAPDQVNELCCGRR